MILGIIPARAGSKRVPQKNIKLLLGKPLIFYTIRSALKSHMLDKVIISTDDLKIAEIAKKYGVDVPFIRPKYLAQDKTLMEPVIQHAVKRIEKLEGCRVEIVVLLQPTCPLRTTKDIDRGIRKILKTKADSVISVCKLEYLSYPNLVKKIKDDRIYPYIKSKREITRHQALPYLYRLNGALYVVRRDTLMNKGTFFGTDTRAIVMEPAKSVDIDTMLDFKMAEYILKNMKT